MSHHIVLLGHTHASFVGRSFVPVMIAFGQTCAVRRLSTDTERDTLDTMIAKVADLKVQTTLLHVQVEHRSEKLLNGLRNQRANITKAEHSDEYTLQWQSEVKDDDSRFYEHRFVSLEAAKHFVEENKMKTFLGNEKFRRIQILHESRVVSFMQAQHVPCSEPPGKTISCVWVNVPEPMIGCTEKKTN